MIEMVKVNGKLIRRKLYLIVDTETFGGFDSPICYDVGLAVIDKTGKVYAKYSFVVHDTFIGMAEEAATAYYAEKFPQYHKDIREGKRKLLPFSIIRQVANQLLEKYQIVDVIAHNAKFDCTSLNNTAKLFGYTSFFSSYIEWWDTLQMVADTIAQQKLYKEFCKTNGYIFIWCLSSPYSCIRRRETLCILLITFLKAQPRPDAWMIHQSCSSMLILLLKE